MTKQLDRPWYKYNDIDLYNNAVISKQLHITVTQLTIVNVCTST